MYITSSTIPETENLIAYNPGHMNNSFPRLSRLFSLSTTHYALYVIRKNNSFPRPKALGLFKYFKHICTMHFLRTHVIIVFL